MKKIFLVAGLICYASQGIAMSDADKKDQENRSFLAAVAGGVIGFFAGLFIGVSAVSAHQENDRPVKLVGQTIIKNIDGSVMQTDVYHYADTGEHAYTKTEQIVASDYERAMQQLAANFATIRQNEADIELAKRKCAARLKQQELDRQQDRLDRQRRAQEAETRRLEAENNRLVLRKEIAARELEQQQQRARDARNEELAAQARQAKAQQQAAQEAYNLKLLKDRETAQRHQAEEQQRQKDKDRQKLADDAKAKDDARKRQELADAELARKLARQEAGTGSTAEALVVQRVAEQSLEKPTCAFCGKGKCKGNLRQLSCGCYACESAQGMCKHKLKL